MTMHLAHPALSMAGKRKGKVKFKNAAEAQKARELDASWKELQKKWGVEQEEKKRKAALSAAPLTYKLSAPVGRETTTHIPSVVTEGGSTSAVHKVYTGDKIIGITIIHKSCLQPVFNQQEAIDAATMRR
jgi:hypothetical protein